MFNVNKLTNFVAKRSEFANVVKNGKATEEESAKAYEEMMDALGSDLTDYIDNKMKLVEAAPINDGMTNEEREFFNAIANGDLSHGTKQEVVLPETTVDEIFEDMVKEHPFLQIIGLKNTGLRVKFLNSDAQGTAVWGKVYGDIKGQLTATFDETDATQSKLTAFVAIPNDLLEYGANWIKTYVSTQIQEAFANALESAFITGDGNDKPIGLTRDVHTGVSVTSGAYPDKTATGKLTFADVATSAKELAGVIKALSKKENGKSFVARGKAVLLVEPGTSLDIEAAMTVQNVNGQWVYALPYGIKIVESEYVPTGKLIAFIPERYDAYVAGNVTIKEYDQALAIEDGRLYTAKRFAYGKAKDNTAALVYTVDTSKASASVSQK